MISSPSVSARRPWSSGIWATASGPTSTREYAGTKLDVEYIEQSVAQGLGHAIHLTREVGRGHPLLIILGDTIVHSDLASVVSGGKSSIGVKEVEDPRRFGVVEMDGERVRKLVEKPENPPSNLAIVGVYYFTSGDDLYDALEEIVRRDVRTKGEVQLTDALQLLLERGHDLGTFPIQGWYDCGKSETLLETNRELLDKSSSTAEAPGSVIIPPIVIEPTATVENCILGPHVSIAAGAVVRNSLVRNSIINEGATVENSLLEASIVGENASVIGNFKNLNVGDSSEVRLT